MEEPRSFSDILYGDARGATRPFLPGLEVLAAMDAVRGADGVWNVVINQDIPHDRD